MQMKYLAGLLAALVLVSCEKKTGSPEDLGENSSIVGTWVEETVEGDTTTLLRAEELDPNRYGFIIGEDGTYVERKNGSWEVASSFLYDNYNGTWTALSDSLLSITVGYWGGSMSYQLRIVSVDETHLSVRYLYADNLADSR